MSIKHAISIAICAALLAPLGMTSAQDSISQNSPGSASVRKGKSPYAAATRFSKPPVVYVVPMAGQMGTDIHPSVYEKILKDVKEVKPDLIVYRLNSADGNMVVNWMEAFQKSMDDTTVDERNQAARIEEYRDLADKLHRELDQFPSVMFVEDARGMASVYALAWSYLYMAPNAWIQGMSAVTQLTSGNSDDVRAKMFAAWTGIAMGVLELGGHPHELSEALVRPDRRLSVDVDGRTTKWRGDDQGTWYVVDDSLDYPAVFTAKTAEDTGLAEGLATDVDDLMLLLGYPEFTKVESGEKIHADYVKRWRDVYKESEKWMEEFQFEPIRQASDLGRKKELLEKMLAAFKQYAAVERMWGWQYGLRKSQIEVWIENIKEQIRAAQKAKEKSKKSGGTGGGGGGLGGGGGVGRR